MAQNRALKMGGIGAPCCCGGCQTTICPNFCGVNVAGILVQVFSGATLIASGTSDSSGCVTLDIGTPGTYSVTISGGSFTTRTLSKTLSCGGTTGAAFADAPSFTLTDSDRTIGVTETSFLSRIYRGCYEFIQPNTELTTQFLPAGGCDVPHTGPVSGNVDIKYQLDCSVTGGSGVWTLTRNWGACFDVTTAVYSSNGTLNTTTCSGGNTVATDSGSLTQTVLSFPFTITLTSGAFGPTGGGNTLSSPLGLGVVIDM